MYLCVQCGSAWTRRLARAWWMRLVRRSVYIECRECRSRCFILRPQRQVR